MLMLMEDGSTRELSAAEVKAEVQKAARLAQWLADEADHDARVDARFAALERQMAAVLDALDRLGVMPDAR